jgi:carbonic anhydrase/acetyltransferase-like protein (isoleucine patch superfamily)
VHVGFLAVVRGNAWIYDQARINGMYAGPNGPVVVEGTAVVFADAKLAGSVHVTGGDIGPGALVDYLAEVHGDPSISWALVSEWARIMDDATVAGEPGVLPKVRVQGTATVRDDANVLDHAVLAGGADVYDDATVRGATLVDGSAQIYGAAKILDDAEVHGDAEVYDDATLKEHARAMGNAHVYGSATLTGNFVASYGDDIFSGTYGE